MLKHNIYYNFLRDIPHDTRKNLYVRLAQRIIDNITTLVWNFFSGFWQWITYTHFSYPAPPLEIQKKGNLLSFQFAATHWHFSIKDVELTMWVLPLSSHMNEPWGMSITHCFDCALPTTCKADTVSAGAPKALQVCTLSRLISASLTIGYLASTKDGSHTENREWDFQLSQNCPISLFPSNPLPITICALHITQILWQMFLKSPLVKTMAHHSSPLAWKIPWAEESGGLQSMGTQRVRHDWATSLSLFTFMHWRRKWQPTPVFLPGESQGWQSLVGCRLWGRTELDTTEATLQQQQLVYQVRSKLLWYSDLVCSI